MRCPNKLLICLLGFFLSSSFRGPLVFYNLALEKSISCDERDQIVYFKYAYKKSGQGSCN